MTSQMLLCPGCRARVLENWTECKFCGQGLAADSIGATVHPDDLAAPPAATGFAPPVAPEPDVPSTGQHDWSQWVNEPEPVASTDHLPPPPQRAIDDLDFPVPPQPPDWNATGVGDSSTPPETHASSWDESPSEQAGLDSAMPTPEPPMVGSREAQVDGGIGWGVPDHSNLPPAPNEPMHEATGWGAPSQPGEALEPLEGANAQWVAGPAPIVPGAEDDLGPSGLDPVSWYTEPSAESAQGFGPSASEPSFTDDPTGGQSFVGDEAGGITGERFDPNALFQEEPEPAMAGGALQRQAPAGEVAVQWKPAAADAWNRAAEPEGAPKGQAVLSREVRLLAFGILAIVVIGLVAKTALDRRNSYPSSWAPDVQGVASWVTHERGLDFKHAVPVRAVDAGEYGRELAAASAGTNDREKQALADRVAALRALGGAQGNPTGTIDAALLTDAASGAFYDVRSGHLVMRQGTNPAGLKVAVAGALSIALDDQYSDTSSLGSASLTEDPLVAVIAGNAALVRADYLADQPADVRAEVVAQRPRSASIGTSFDAARAALAVGTGNGLVSLVRNVESVADVNKMSVIPPGSDQQVINPTVYLEGQRPLTADTPVVPDGAKQIDSGTIGAATWYLLIAERLDAGRAFSAVESWAGDSFVTYRKSNGTVCVADVLRAADDNSANALLDTLKDWRSAVPGDHIDVSARPDDQVAVTACDPGASAAQALDGGYDAVVRAAVTRSMLAAGFYEKGTKVPNGPNGPILTPTQAWCMADRAVGKTSADEMKDLASATGDLYKSRTLEAGAACGSNLVAQLFRPS